MHAVIELTLPAKSEYLILTRLALSGLARTASIDDELLADLKLAVTEACGNVVHHAYPETAAGVMCVRYVVEDGQIEITVEDFGEGIRAGTVTRAAADGASPVVSGMGVPIMRATMDRVSVSQRGDGVGTVVTMTTRLDRQRDEAHVHDDGRD